MPIHADHDRLIDALGNVLGNAVVTVLGSHDGDRVRVSGSGATFNVTLPLDAR